jgi:hypothetical protein
MPEWRAVIRRRLAGLALRPVDEIDIVEELAQHVEDRYADLVSAGASEEEAVGGSLGRRRADSRDVGPADRKGTRDTWFERSRGLKPRAVSRPPEAHDMDCAAIRVLQRKKRNHFLAALAAE